MKTQELTKVKRHDCRCMTGCLLRQLYKYKLATFNIDVGPIIIVHSHEHDLTGLVTCSGIGLSANNRQNPG